MNTMTPERWQRIQQLFEQALPIEPAQRAAWLATQCGADETLRNAVQALLANDGSTNTLDGAMEDRKSVV